METTFSAPGITCEGCAGTIKRTLGAIKGVAGVHVMAYRQEEYVSEIVHESGVLAGRTPWRRDLAPSPVPHEEMVAAE